MTLSLYFYYNFYINSPNLGDNELDNNLPKTSIKINNSPTSTFRIFFYDPTPDSALIFALVFAPIIDKYTNINL